MLKKQYETPNLQFYDVTPEVKFLYSTTSGNVETMNSVNGVWDDEDE